MNVIDRDRSQSSYDEDVFRVESGTDVRHYMKRKKEPACFSCVLAVFVHLRCRPAAVSSLEEFLRGFATFGMIVHVIEYIVHNT
jgi:hypothetical protein